MNERRTFTTDEQRAFNAYCLALQSLADVTTGFDGTSSSGGKCEHCGGAVPAGIPKPLAGGERDACPACVLARDLHKSIRDDLAEIAGPEMTADERRKLLDSAVSPPRRPSTKPRELGAVMRGTRGTRVATGIDATIDRLRNELQNARTDEDRTRLRRQLEAAEHARERHHQGAQP